MQNSKLGARLRYIPVNIALICRAHASRDDPLPETMTGLISRLVEDVVLENGKRGGFRGFDPDAPLDSPDVLEVIRR